MDSAVLQIEILMKASTGFLLVLRLFSAAWAPFFGLSAQTRRKFVEILMNNVENCVQCVIRWSVRCRFMSLCSSS